MLLVLVNDAIMNMKMTMLMPLLCFLKFAFETDAAAQRGIRCEGTADATFNNDLQQ